MMKSNRFGLSIRISLVVVVALCIAIPSTKAAFHLWQIQEVFTNADGSVQFIEMKDNSPGETLTNGLHLSANSSGSVQSVTLTNLAKPTPGSLLFATSGFGSLPGGVIPDFTIPALFFNPNAASITVSFNGSNDAITFSGSSLPHDGLHSLNDANIPFTPNLVSATNTPTNLSGNSGAVNLSAPSPTGDYNGNHTVDAADYVLWRRTLNTTVSPNGSGADGSGDGTINAADYAFWRARFGNSVSGSGLSEGSSVPEPVAVCGWMATAILIGAAHRRRSVR